MYGNCHAQKWLKLNKSLYSQSKEDEHANQVVSDTMYKTWCSLLQVLHLSFRCISTIQKVRRPVSDCVQVQRTRRDNTLLPRQQRLFSFQNEQFVYVLKRSRHGDYMNVYVAKTGDKTSMHCDFSSHKRVLNRIGNCLKVYRFIPEDFNRVARGKLHDIRYNCICNTFFRGHKPINYQQTPQQDGFI